MEIFQTVFEWYMANLNYFTIWLLMTVESSFVPFPSEIVVPFAAWKAGEGSLTMAGVLLASTAGAMSGAIINYYLSIWLGRPLLYRLHEVGPCPADQSKQCGECRKVFRETWQGLYFHRQTGAGSATADIHPGRSLQDEHLDIPSLYLPGCRSLEHYPGTDRLFRL